jgi:hypothetical protein
MARQTRSHPIRYRTARSRPTACSCQVCQMSHVVRAALGDEPAYEARCEVLKYRHADSR